MPGNFCKQKKRNGREHMSDFTCLRCTVGNQPTTCVWKQTGLCLDCDGVSWAGPIDPFMVGITNLPKMGRRYEMFPLGGHMGPPLR